MKKTGKEFYWATPGFDDWPQEKWLTVLTCLAENNYAGIEPLISGEYQMDGRLVQDLLQSRGLKIFGFRTGGIAQKYNVSFNHPDESKRQEAIDRFVEMVHYAAQFGNPKLLVGLMQGNILEGQNISDAEERIGSALKFCSDHAAKYNMEIGLEPVNHFEVNHHNTTQSMHDFINKIGTKNIHMLIDAYHMHIENEDVENSILSTGSLISHVHLADSNRAIPGKGVFDFQSLFRVLEQVDYAGCFTIEAKTDSSEKEISDTMVYLEKILSEKEM